VELLLGNFEEEITRNNLLSEETLTVLLKNITRWEFGIFAFGGLLVLRSFCFLFRFILFGWGLDFSRLGVCLLLRRGGAATIARGTVSGAVGGTVASGSPVSGTSGTGSFGVGIGTRRTRVSVRL